MISGVFRDEHAVRFLRSEPAREPLCAASRETWAASCMKSSSTEPSRMAVRVTGSWAWIRMLLSCRLPPQSPSPALMATAPTFDRNTAGSRPRAGANLSTSALAASTSANSGLTRNSTSRSPSCASNRYALTWIHLSIRRSKTVRTPRPAKVTLRSDVESAGPRMRGMAHRVPLNGGMPVCSSSKSSVRSATAFTSTVWPT